MIDIEKEVHVPPVSEWRKLLEDYHARQRLELTVKQEAELRALEILKEVLIGI